MVGILEAVIIESIELFFIDVWRGFAYWLFRTIMRGLFAFVFVLLALVHVEILQGTGMFLFLVGF